MVLTAMVFAAAATAALAAGGVSTASKSRTFVGTGAAAAPCPRGKRAVGGGFSVPVGAIAQQEFPAGGSRWRVESYNLASSTGVMTAYARCEPKAKDKLKRVTKAKRSRDPATPVAVASCPRGTHVLSGGFKVSPPYDPDGGDAGEIAVFESRRISTRKWRVSGINQGDPTKLIAYAVCGDDSRGAVSQAANDAVVSAQSTKVTAGCQAGSHTTGGGFKVPAGGASDIPMARVSKPGGSRDWIVTFLTRGPTGKVFSYAYCERN